MESDNLHWLFIYCAREQSIQSYVYDGICQVNGDCEFSTFRTVTGKLI